MSNTYVIDTPILDEHMSDTSLDNNNN